MMKASTKQVIEQGEAEDELYNAYKDFCFMDVTCVDMTHEEALLTMAQIQVRCDNAYENAVRVLGQQWADCTVENAKRDCGEDELD